MIDLIVTHRYEGLTGKINAPGTKISVSPGLARELIFCGYAVPAPAPESAPADPDTNTSSRPAAKRRSQP